MNNNLSLLRIIGGLSRTLNIANQMIPIYKQVKPLISNSGKVLAKLQNTKLNQKNNTNAHKINNNQIVENRQITLSNINAPTFFQ